MGKLYSLSPVQYADTHGDDQKTLHHRHKPLPMKIQLLPQRISRLSYGLSSYPSH